MNSVRILEILSDTIEKDPQILKTLPPDANLTEQGLDSLRFIQLVVSLEEAFGIEIRDSDLLLSNFDTPGKLFTTLETYFVPLTLKKVLICDCDNVLWRGIAGEEPLSLPPCFRSFHAMLLQFYHAGVLLCLCSRNEPENIQDAFCTLAMPLTETHFILKKVSRASKSDSIREIATELNLSPDSFVFLDDSDYELGLIDALLPEVTTVKADFMDDSFLAALQNLFPQNASSRDFNRTEAYREQKAREKEKRRFQTAAEYNASLETQIRCHPADLSEVARIAELSQRTNQCNLSGSRYSEDEIRAFLTNPDYIVISLSVTDRYGDMGIVSAAIVKLDEQLAVIESFYLSCRAFDRGMEEALLNGIRDASGVKNLYGYYRETPKNKRYGDFYARNGVKAL